MTQLILILSMSPVMAPTAARSIEDCQRNKNCVAQVEICQYPHKCSGQRSAAVAQVQTCVWPHVCSKEARLPMVAQFEPCVWPNRCAKEQPVQAVAQFQPCVWPNRCERKAASLI